MQLNICSSIKKIISLQLSVRNKYFPPPPFFYEHKSLEFKQCFLFTLCIVLYCVYLLANQSGWVLGGEMWSEMGDNYFLNATTLTLDTFRFLSVLLHWLAIY